jgi:hypothetical protein
VHKTSTSCADHPIINSKGTHICKKKQNEKRLEKKRKANPMLSILSPPSTNSLFRASKSRSRIRILSVHRETRRVGFCLRRPRTKETEARRPQIAITIHEAALHFIKAPSCHHLVYSRLSAQDKTGHYRS